MFRLFGLLLIASSFLLAEENEAVVEGPSVLPRWVFVDEANLATRSLSARDGASVVTDGQLQYGVLFSGGVRAGEWISLHALASTGGDFVNGWNNTGLGKKPLDKTIYLKQLFVTIAPAKGAELAVGSMEINRGVGTDITSYSEDGYMMGGRLAIHKPRSLYFDEVSATAGYLGDTDTPGIQDRYQRLTQVNYRQLMAVKKVGEKIAVSLDYTDHAGAKTFRQSLHLKTLDLKVIDGFRADFYQRGNFNRATGMALSGEKSIRPGWDIELGYASIDPHFGEVTGRSLNNEGFFEGRRVFASTNMRITDSVAAFVTVTRAVGNSYTVPIGTYVAAGVRFSAAKAIRSGAIKKLAKVLNSLDN